VIGDAGDDDTEALDRDDPLDDPDRDAGAIQRAPLLDVQLEVGVVRPLRPDRVGDAIGLPPIRRTASARRSRSRPGPCRRA
jgi:hypothetical protein